MHMPLEMDFGPLPASPAAKDAIRAGAARLSRYYPELIGCRVCLGAASGAAEARIGAHIHIRLTVPGGVVEVSHSQSKDDPLESALQDAFDVLQMRLADFVATQRGRAPMPS